MPTTPSRLASAPRPAGPFEILLTRASINSLVRHLQALGLPMRDRGELETAMSAGLPGVMEWVEDCVDALILPILSSVRVLDVPRVVVDGDLPRDLLDQLIERLGAALEAASPESRDPPELLAGRIGRGAAAFGAAILPLHINYSPSRSILVGQELAS
jgi:predicted NBD/HSP70 family sugar kinase